MADAHPSVEELDASLDTPDGTDPDLIRHIRQCPTCERSMGELRAIRRRLAALRGLEPALPEDWDAFLRRIGSVCEDPVPEHREGPATSRRAAALVAAAVAGISAVGIPVYLTSRSDEPRQRATVMAHEPPQPSARVTVLSSGDSYTRSNAARMVHALAARAGEGSSIAAATPTTGCRLPQAVRRATIVDHGRFEGQDAMVYISRHGGRYTAVFVAPGCHITTLSNL